jgi:hypothetical protein
MNLLVIIIIYTNIKFAEPKLFDEQQRLPKQKFQELEQKALNGDIDASSKITRHFVRGFGDRQKAFNHIKQIADTTDIKNAPVVMLARYTLSNLYKNEAKFENFKLEADKEKVRYYSIKAVEYIVFDCDKSCLDIKGSFFFYDIKPACDILADEIAFVYINRKNSDNESIDNYANFYEKYCMR